LKLHLYHFSKIKIQKESQNNRNQGFSYYFCMMIEGSGSIPLTSGSGSWRLKNTWIRWIRIRNTGKLENITSRKRAICHVIKENKTKNYFLVFGGKPARGQPKPPPPCVAPELGDSPTWRNEDWVAKRPNGSPE
jgi:hypothetical protein